MDGDNRENKSPTTVGKSRVPGCAILLPKSKQNIVDTVQPTVITTQNLSCRAMIYVTSGWVALVSYQPIYPARYDTIQRRYRSVRTVNLPIIGFVEISQFPHIQTLARSRPSTRLILAVL